MSVVVVVDVVGGVVVVGAVVVVVSGAGVEEVVGAGTVHGRQFDWGGLLPKRNGAVS